MRELKGKAFGKGRQFYVGVSLSTNEMLVPLFPSMNEHYFMENHEMKTMLGMLAPEQPWHRTKLVWAGSHDDFNRFLTKEHAEKYDHYNLYDVAKLYFTRIIEERKNHWKLSAKYEPIAKRVICLANHDLREYCLLTDLPRSVIDGFRICPLPLLTASVSSTHYYEGDYDSDDETQEWIGRWAGHSISSEFAIPEGYTEIEPDFWEKPGFEIPCDLKKKVTA